MDVFRILWVALDLRAQAVDVRVHRMIVPAVLIAPRLIEELLAAVDPTGMAGEMHQQIELACGELDSLSANRYRMSLDVDAHVTRLQQVALCRLVLLAEHLDAPEQRFHASGELHYAERFGEIVVGTDLEAEHTIELA